MIHPMRSASAAQARKCRAIYSVPFAMSVLALPLNAFFGKSDWISDVCLAACLAVFVFSGGQLGYWHWRVGRAERVPS